MTGSTNVLKLFVCVLPLQVGGKWCRTALSNAKVHADLLKKKVLAPAERLFLPIFKHSSNENLHFSVQSSRIFCAPCVNLSHTSQFEDPWPSTCNRLYKVCVSDLKSNSLFFRCGLIVWIRSPSKLDMSWNKPLVFIIHKAYVL